MFQEPFATLRFFEIYTGLFKMSAGVLALFSPSCKWGIPKMREVVTIVEIIGCLSECLLFSNYLPDVFRGLAGCLSVRLNYYFLSLYLAGF